MNLSNKTILHCSQYAAPYKGNFIKALEALALQLEMHGSFVYFLFPESCQCQPWWEDFCYKHKTRIIGQVTDVKSIEKIISELKPDIIHTHFDGFDIPVSKAIVNIRIKTIQVWHLHNCLSFLSHPLKALYQYYCYFLHYNWYAKDVVMIGVGQHLVDFTERFRKVLFYKRPPQFVIPNGIDTTRIRPRSSFKRHQKFTFLAYGGRNADKRIDYLLRAAAKLESDYQFEIMITDGTDTRLVINSIYSCKVPTWLKLVKQQEDICNLLDQVDTFVSTSVHEGHSYAICEASIFGLPIIQSDIPGNLWNSQSPATFSFRSGNIDDLARVMKKVMAQSDESLQQRCEITRKLNLERYSLERWTEQVYEVYNKLK